MNVFVRFIVALALGCTIACDEPERPTSTPSPDEEQNCEHGLPRELCPKCNPQLVAVYQAHGDWCPEHGFAESFCPICNPGAAPRLAEPYLDAEPATTPELSVSDIENRLVRLASPEIETIAGIEAVVATRTASEATVECTARVEFDADRVADIRAIVPGIVRRVRAQLGASVERGAPLFELESTRVGEIQGVLQAARERVRTAEADLGRQRELRESDIASARQVEVAERELASARAEARTAEATLRIAGAARSDPSGRYTLRSPIAGAVVRRPAVVGLLATESESLATIADTSVMWALCDVRERDAHRVAAGQTAIVSVRGLDDATGTITWIAAEVDPRTRTVEARAEIPNPDGRLRANQFARAQILVGEAAEAVQVPRAAVQRVGEHEVVFIQMEPGLYQPRVVVRHGDSDQVHVEGRVRPGDRIVTTGAVLLRTEIMPGSIGAGCCEVPEDE